MAAPDHCVSRPKKPLASPGASTDGPSCLVADLFSRDTCRGGDPADGFAGITIEHGGDAHHSPFRQMNCMPSEYHRMLEPATVLGVNIGSLSSVKPPGQYLRAALEVVLIIVEVTLIR